MKNRREVKNERVFVSALIPPNWKKEIQNAANSNNYLSESDFIRTAIRKLLDSHAEEKRP